MSGLLAVKGHRRGHLSGAASLAASLAACAAALAGCQVSLEPSFTANGASQRVSAALEAVAERDRDAIPELIVMLDSWDPGERVVAINALERLTGERFGFDPSAPRYLREPAVERWVAWAHAEQLATPIRSRPSLAVDPEQSAQPEPPAAGARNASERGASSASLCPHPSDDNASRASVEPAAGRGESELLGSGLPSGMEHQKTTAAAG